jgi:hypothetical protein
MARVPFGTDAVGGAEIRGRVCRRLRTVGLLGLQRPGERPRPSEQATDSAPRRNRPPPEHPCGEQGGGTGRRYRLSRGRRSGERVPRCARQSLDRGTHREARHGASRAATREGATAPGCPDVSRQHQRRCGSQRAGDARANGVTRRFRTHEHAGSDHQFLHHSGFVDNAPLKIEPAAIAGLIRTHSLDRGARGVRKLTWFVTNYPMTLAAGGTNAPRADRWSISDAGWRE